MVGEKEVSLQPLGLWEAWSRCGHQAGVVSKVNQGHPPSVYTTVINCALFPAPPGKVPENWVCLARWGCRVRTGRFGEGMPLGTQR